MIINPKIHTLANDATLIFTSPGHGARFSDGTSCEPQHKEVCDQLNCQRRTTVIGKIKGMELIEMKMLLSEEQLSYLDQLCRQADLVLVPFMVLTALRESGQRARFPNVVCTISTKETERSAPQDKVWDCNKWSY